MTQHTAAPSSSNLFEKISQISARLEQVSPLSGSIPTVPQVTSQQPAGGTRFTTQVQEPTPPVQPWGRAS
ncbi:MAG: hypothetical protein Q4A03_06125 [Rothia sp. (in: high G+C Gram-positive bacteria)]|uniref:hypothetical protein n=1 Tax=Rothia sp. (in: high G+C Gram-positive bacteria) TaxID=1885016 RepID=UPI0026F60EE8|nr:hypothetical protein [Rothia sp. (in: high G+C Gram-positive bacteria)]